MICIGEVKNTSGIYLITNIVNGKVYVGSSIDLLVRYSQHFRNLKKGKHSNIHLQYAWNKYGENNFYFTVIELVPEEKDRLLEREQHWIDFYKCSDNEFGYNINPTAGSSLGRKIPKKSDEERRRRMYSCSNNKLVLQFDVNGNLLKEWFSVQEVSREFNVDRHVVDWALKSKKKFNNSYLIYKYEFTDDLLKLVLLGKKETRKGSYKKVNQYDKNGTFIRMWDSITIAAESLSVHAVSIVNCCKKRSKSAGGFAWSYAD